MRRKIETLTLSGACAVIATVVGLNVSATGINAGPRPARAGPDCQTIHGYAYASGGIGDIVADGVRADMSYFNPTVCYLGAPHHGQFSGESITLCKNGTCNGWIQVGLHKRYGWTEPKMYCEFAPHSSTGNLRQIDEFEVTNESHEYRASLQTRSGTQWWDCARDGVFQSGWPVSYLGFSYGTWAPVQGETDSLYSQIGKNAPTKFAFANMAYRSTTLSWQILNLCATCLNNPPYQYGRDEPGAGSFRNWTN